MSRRSAALGPTAFVLALALAACGSVGLQKVNARLSLDHDALDFGQRPVLDDLTLKVHATNLGQAPLEMTLTIEGDAAFTLVGGELHLDGGAETDFSVNFKATEKKAYAGKLVIDTNEADGPRHEVPLTGTGATAASATVEPSSLDFGRVGEGRTAVKRVKITSTGTADLKIKTIELKPGSSPAYAFVGSTRTPQLLAHHVEGTGDAFAEVTVKFAPTADKLATEGTLVLETTDPDHALVEVALHAAINRQPVAEPGPDRQVAPGTKVDLDGSHSSDPDGDLPLVFKWTLATRPQGSASALVGADAATPSLTVDQPGGYGVDLVVTDAAGLASKPRRLTVTAVAADKLIVQLIWDHPIADLDLHFLRPGDALDTVNDCSWEHPHPDWGVVGDPNDDPAHLGDKLSGFGPETVVYEQPPDGRYRIVVKYASAQGSATPQLRATVRVYLYGAVQRELDHVMNGAGEVWEAGTVDWPTGLVLATGEGVP